jgi:hypothetical protein
MFTEQFKRSLRRGLGGTHSTNWIHARKTLQREGVRARAEENGARFQALKTCSQNSLRPKVLEKGSSRRHTTSTG